jgi:hypothetical protein
LDLSETLGVMAGAAVLGVLLGWLGARPPDLHRGPRLVPYRFLMMLCGAVVLFMVVHLVNLMGFTTGGR